MGYDSFEKVDKSTKKKMEYGRESYLRQLISRKHSRLIKIVSGIRRCGKSYLLNILFKKHLIETGVPEERVISISLDDFEQAKYRDPATLYNYVKESLRSDDMHYLLLDEVQMLGEFESVLNGLMRRPNLDIYVTGSNSRFLSTDVVTEFRGRGEEIRVYPLSFAEYAAARPGVDWWQIWREYSLYGGMPLVASYDDDSQKENYLRSLMLETYLKDIVERNKLQNFEALEELVDMLASGIGGLTNAAKLERRFKSEKGITLSAPTIRQYLDFMQDAFLVQRVSRYDIKGKRYINTPCKYYFTDIGLRNARINFRQPDMPHIMENVIYNELCIRGFSVDVGEVKILTPEREQKSVEVDFVVNRGSNRYYIQSAWAMPSEEKRRQEIRPLQRIRDDFRKILIVNDMMPSHQSEEGITVISLYDFLLNTEQMQRLFRF